jgi:hypothetical protein
MPNALASEPSQEVRKVPADAFRFAAAGCELAASVEGSANVPVTILARTGQPIDHWYWGKVIHDMKGLKLHKKALALDYLHLDTEILGYLDSFDTKTGDLVVSGQIIPYVPGDRANEIIHKGHNGVPYEASIYFAGPTRIEEVSPGASAKVNGYVVEGPAVIFRQWSLRGVAICPHGYDRNTKTQLTAGDGDVPVEFFSMGTPVPGQQSNPTISHDSAHYKEQPMPDAAPSPEQLTDSTPETKPTEKPAGELSEPTKPEGAKPEQPAGELVNAPAALDDPRAEVKKFIDAFGPEGATWFADGKTFGEAQQLHSKQLSRENEELKKKLKAAQLGEAEPVSFADGEAGGKGGKPTEFSNLPDGLAQFAASVKLPGKKN